MVLRLLLHPHPVETGAPSGTRSRPLSPWAVPNWYDPDLDRRFDEESPGRTPVTVNKLFVKTSG